LVEQRLQLDLVVELYELAGARVSDRVLERILEGARARRRRSGRCRRVPCCWARAIAARRRRFAAGSVCGAGGVPVGGSVG
jgi:hypothetical protein